MTDKTELRDAYIKVQVDLVPDTEDEFKKWCEKYGFDCFGLGVGRRAWCSQLSTYLRDADGVAFYDGEMMLYYKEDAIDLDQYAQERETAAHTKGKLIGVSNSNDAYHDLSAPDLATWFHTEMKNLEEDIAEFTSNTKKDGDA